jgi:hypothetical protein
MMNNFKTLSILNFKVAKTFLKIFKFFEYLFEPAVRSLVEKRDGLKMQNLLEMWRMRITFRDIF